MLWDDCAVISKFFYGYAHIIQNVGHKKWPLEALMHFKQPMNLLVLRS